VCTVFGAVGERVATGLRASGVVGLAFLANCLIPTRLVAEAVAPRNEIFTGFEASDNYASGYLGGGYAFGKGLYDPGWRVRAVASYGRYHYDRTLRIGADDVAIEFHGEEFFGSALVGYQFHPGARLIVKLFAGIESDSQIISPHDPKNSVQGSALGVKLQAESWSDLTETLFLSADASYGSAFQQYWGLARLGFRAHPRLSLGLEGGVVGNEEYDAGRGGGFLRTYFGNIEATLSGGFTGNYLEDDPSFYVSLGAYRRF
jgi:hypothetical protein